LPLKFGGTGTYSEDLTPPISYPESLEAGTITTPNIFSLNAGLKYVEKHFEKINKKIESLTKFLLENLAEIKNIKVYTHKDCYHGVVSFNIVGVPCSDVVSYLNAHNVYVRGGFHCAPLVHKHLKTLEIGGTVRISISSFNHFWQIKKVVKLLKKFAKQI
jgi:selenocysteine lyase/cysteine desulfurase